MKVLLGIVFIITSNLFAQEYLLGSWYGNRTAISEFGIDFGFKFTGEYFSVINSDLKNNSCYLDNINLTATVDFEKILGWNGATLFADILGNNGGIPNDRVGTSGRYGTIQGISNIAAPNTWKLYQFWIEQNFLNSKLSLLFGLYDLNSEFDTRETSGIFINPSHGIGAEYAQSGKNGPSIFPTTSLASRIKYKHTENTYLLLGVFDGVPGNLNNQNGTQIILNKNDGLLIAYEIGLLENGENFVKGFAKYSLGGWYYTTDFEDISEVDNTNNPILRNNNYGLYISAEKFLLAEKDDSSQGLAAFLRFGFANSDINPLNYYWGAGLNITGLIPIRDNDILGIAIGTAHAGKKFIEVNKANGDNIIENEIIIEFTYSFQATDWLRIQPDFQYVMNPMGTGINERARVMGVRAEIIF